MAKAEKKKADEAGAPAWMVTFADMMTLLLCFFVILFSMSQIRIIKFGALASTLKSALRGAPDAPPTRRKIIPKSQNKGAILPMPGVSGRRKPTPSVGRDRGSTGDGGKGEQSGKPDATKKLVQAAGLDEFAGLVQVEEDTQFTKIRIPGDLTFRSGRAALGGDKSGEDIEELMERISMVLKWVPNNVIVLGHTDDTPTSSAMFPSNWELSSARAAAVVRHLVGNYRLDESRFTVVGKGHTDPLMIPVNATARKKNRRVELWIRKRGDKSDGLQELSP